MKQRTKEFGLLCVKKMGTFLYIMVLVTLLSNLFKVTNTLPMVAVAIGIQMAPTMNINTKPLTLAITVFLLFLGCGVSSYLSLWNPYLGLLINLLFLGGMMLLVGEPYEERSFIPFLLCYIFCQTTPVNQTDFYYRMMGIGVGALLMAILIVWKKRKQDTSKCMNIKTYIKATIPINKGFHKRIVVGLAIAMFIGQYFGLAKPLWISIVVMSLTQREFGETKMRIRHRIYATVIASCIFVLVFQMMVPDQYTSFLTLCIGYMMGFMSNYRHKQILNAINALCASLVFLDSSTAVFDRFLFLFVGIAIVLVMQAIHFIMKYIKEHVNTTHFSHAS